MNVLNVIVVYANAISSPRISILLAGRAACVYVRLVASPQRDAVVRQRSAIAFVLREDYRKKQENAYCKIVFVLVVQATVGKITVLNRINKLTSCEIRLQFRNQSSLVCCQGSRQEFCSGR